MKKIIILTLIIVLAVNMNVCSKTLDTTENITLSDIQNHWAKDDITYLIEKGCINGYLDGTFQPDWSITVAEFTKILVTSLGYTDIQIAHGEHWALNYINKAEELGLIEDGEFTDYNAQITRGEIARMVVRAIDEQYPENIDLYKKQITDYDYIKTAYQDYVLKAYVKGIITGYEDNSFKDTNKATRAESTTMIVRMLDEKRRIIPEKPIVVSEEVTNNEMEEIIERLREYGTTSWNTDDFEQDNDESLNKGWSYWILDTYQDTINNIELLHNRNYKTMDKEEYKNQLKYYLQDTWYYAGNEYENPLNFIEKYIQDTMDYNVIVESEFITDEKLIHSAEGNPAIRGVFRFKYTSHENPENIVNELDLIYVDNQGYPEQFKIGQWYEVDMDIHLSGYRLNDYVTWEHSRYFFTDYDYLSEFREVEIK